MSLRRILTIESCIIYITVFQFLRFQNNHHVASGYVITEQRMSFHVDGSKRSHPLTNLHSVGFLSRYEINLTTCHSKSINTKQTTRPNKGHLLICAESEDLLQVLLKPNLTGRKPGSTSIGSVESKVVTVQRSHSPDKVNDAHSGSLGLSIVSDVLGSNAPPVCKLHFPGVHFKGLSLGLLVLITSPQTSLAGCSSDA